MRYLATSATGITIWNENSWGLIDYELAARNTLTARTREVLSKYYGLLARR